MDEQRRANVALRWQLANGYEWIHQHDTYSRNPETDQAKTDLNP
jgi:hypothetical protein